MGLDQVTNFDFTKVPQAVGVATNASEKLIQKTDNIRQVLAFAKTIFKGLEIHGFSVATSLVSAVKTSADMLSIWKWAPRVHELASTDVLRKGCAEGKYNILRFVSRVALAVADVLAVYKVLDKLGAIAAGTGNGITAFFSFCLENKVITIFGTFGATLELLDTMSQVYAKGLNWERGFSIVGNSAKVIVLAIGESSAYSLALFGVVASTVGFGAFITRFIKTEFFK